MSNKFFINEERDKILELSDDNAITAFDILADHLEDTGEEIDEEIPEVEEEEEIAEDEPATPARAEKKHSPNTGSKSEEILKLLGEGLKAKEVAEQVGTTVQNVYAVKSRAKKDGGDSDKKKFKLDELKAVDNPLGPIGTQTFLDSLEAGDMDDDELMAEYVLTRPQLDYLKEHARSICKRNFN